MTPPDRMAAREAVPSPAPLTPRRLLRWLLRAVLTGAMFWLLGRLDGAAAMPALPLAAAACAGLALLAIGAGFARARDIGGSRALDWLLLPPWVALFWFTLRLLEGAIATGPLRALAAAVLSMVASVVLTLTGVLLRDTLGRVR